MSRERLYLFDTTLRDGAQTNGVDFTLHDKLAIIAMLDDIGIDYVEGGYPGANPIDTALFAETSGKGRFVIGCGRPGLLLCRAIVLTRQTFDAGAEDFHEHGRVLR